MRARVYITLKEGVLDPKGQAVCQALTRLGFDEVQDVRIGKLIEIEIAESKAAERGDARARIEEMCQRLLHNPVVEDFRIEAIE